MSSLSDFLSSLDWRDLLDILAVALIIYWGLLLIRGTRAVQVLLGMLVLVGISYLAKATGLITLEWLLANFVILIPFVIVVFFQDQIRRALATFGDTSILGLGQRQAVDSTLNEIVRAASEMARRRIGALIVLEGQQGLRDYVEKGTRLDAEVSSDLLINLFTPPAPLHDGAVIVQRDRIAAAGCFLPLTRQMGIASDVGTRHRAALGLSDQTDGLALVISEESGEISVAVDGVLNRKLDAAALHTLLLQHLTRATESQAPQKGSLESEEEEGSA